MDIWRSNKFYFENESSKSLSRLRDDHLREEVPMARLVARFLPMWAAILLFAPQPARAISPPQYTPWAEIKNSVGVTPGVEVGDLIDKGDGLYVVPIKVKAPDRAIAIASILTLSHKIGNLTVQVQVTDGDGHDVKPVIPASSEQLADLVRQALKGNHFLKEVIVKATPISPKKVVFAVFTKDVIQFPNDDLSDLYGNFNGVAAAVFRDVLADEPGGYVLDPSTAK